ncbi:MAG: hypothetical protein IOC80_01740 [Rhodobacter sp.]|nr:hypothetical protein [Rhodobacter sp.]MCA3520903.1 hypothetical protein [Rhodobacter sp.]MCA3522454.1 hypothetical protein [Rhodobacter sp.]MCA3526633.1 hypothetical protein [Rhodobacter sp.]MCA3529516.1 hypothetical protein [Rhodobacter sp.]
MTVPKARSVLSCGSGRSSDTSSAAPAIRPPASALTGTALAHPRPAQDPVSRLPAPGTARIMQVR